jgi:hypothetical protein
MRKLDIGQLPAFPRPALIPQNAWFLLSIQRSMRGTDSGTTLRFEKHGRFASFFSISGILAILAILQLFSSANLFTTLSSPP